MAVVVVVVTEAVVVVVEEEVVKEGGVPDETVEVEADEGVDPTPAAVDEVVVVDDVVVVDVIWGPTAASFTAGENPRSAASMLGSFPSMPSAQMPTPAKLLEVAICAASYREVGSSKKVSCHWLPTWYDVQAVSVVESQ